MRPLLLDRLANALDDRRIGIGALQKTTISTDDLVGGVAGHPRETRVGKRDRVILVGCVGDQDAVVNGLDGFLQQHPLALLTATLGDVADVGEQTIAVVQFDVCQCDLDREQRSVAADVLRLVPHALGDGVIFETLAMPVPIEIGIEPHRRHADQLFDWVLQRLGHRMVGVQQLAVAIQQHLSIDVDVGHQLELGDL